MPIWYSRHTLYLPFSIFFGLRFNEQVRSWYNCFIVSNKVFIILTEAYGPKYSEPSLIICRVGKILGKGSFLIHNQGNDLSSFSWMLYRGWYFFTRLFSKSSASNSVFVTTNLMSSIFLTSIFNFPDWWVLVK